MHTFVVVNVRPGRRVPDHVRRILASATHSDLTFVPDAHVHWADDADGLHFAGWQLGGRHLGVGSRWEVRPSGVTAFSGHTWLNAEPWRPGAGWASQLADRLTGTDRSAVARRLDGAFDLVQLDSRGTGFLAGDPLGVGLIYHGRNSDLTVYSNRAALAARVLAPEGKDPQRDVEGAVCMAYANNLLTERTTFAGVSTLPRATEVHIAPERNPVHHQWSAMPWIDPDLVGVDESPELFTPAIDHMRALTRAMAALPSWQRTLELTGGRDSRMILALLLAEEVADEFNFITFGSSEIPDVQVAGELADLYDLDLRAQGRERKPRKQRGAQQDPPLGPSRPGPPPAAVEPISFEAELRRHVWQTSGMVSVWHPITNGRDLSPNVALTGQMGELLRTNYPRTTGIRSVADMDRFVRAGAFGFDAARIFRRSSRRASDDAVVSQLHSLLPPGGTAQDAIDGFNQVARLRRWFGTSNELDNRNRLFPLYSMPATRAAFAIGSHRRRLEVLPFEIIRATRPELATIRFAPSAWPESLISTIPDGDRYPTSPDVPAWTAPSWRELRRQRRAKRRTQEAPRLASEQRAMRDLDKKIPVLRQFLDLGPGHDLYRHLDYDATMRAVTDLADLDFLARRSLHDAVTAAMWLGGADEPERF